MVSYGRFKRKGFLYERWFCFFSDDAFDSELETMEVGNIPKIYFFVLGRSLPEAVRNKNNDIDLPRIGECVYFEDGKDFEVVRIKRDFRPDSWGEVSIFLKEVPS